MSLMKLTSCSLLRWLQVPNTLQSRTSNNRKMHGNWETWESEKGDVLLGISFKDVIHVQIRCKFLGYQKRKTAIQDSYEEFYLP